MSESHGNNPVTGEARPSEDTQAKTVEKSAKRQAAADQSEAKRLDTRLLNTLKSAEQSMTKLSEAIAACKEGDVWKLTVDAEGKPFKSWAAYLSDRLSTQPLMHKVVRNAVIKELLDAGMSIRATAKAVGASVGTVAGAKAEAEGRAARPGGDTAGLTPTAQQIATKAVTQAMNALKRVKDHVADMSDAELAKLNIELTETTNIVRGIVNLRKQAVARQVAETAGKPAEPSAKVPA